jgi:hypothetical protein
MYVYMKENICVYARHMYTKMNMYIYLNTYTKKHICIQILTQYICIYQYIYIHGTESISI